MNLTEKNSSVSKRYIAPVPHRDRHQSNSNSVQVKSNKERAGIAADAESKKRRESEKENDATEVPDMLGDDEDKDVIF